MKALAATLAAAIIALVGTGQVTSPALAIAGFLPVILFWILDAKYLRLERQFRRLYDDIRLGKIRDHFTMDVQSYSSKVETTFKIARSWSVAWFYLPIILILSVVAVQIACF